MTFLSIDSVTLLAPSINWNTLLFTAQVLIIAYWQVVEFINEVQVTDDLGLEYGPVPFII